MDDSGAVPTWGDEEVEEEQVVRRRVFEFQEGAVRQPLSEQQAVNKDAKSGPSWSLRIRTTTSLVFGAVRLDLTAVGLA